MRSEQSWSLIDPKPVLLYISSCDEYIVYWNGVAMTHKMALCMAMEHASGVYATPEMKTALEQDYERLYYSNAFKTRAWDLKVADSPVYPFLKRIMKEHLIKIIREPKRPAQEVLGWFDYSRARKEENV
jgi:hypothetical protein